MKLSFYGASDDLVEMERVRTQEGESVGPDGEIGCFEEFVDIIIGDPDGDGPCTLLRYTYCPDICGKDGGVWGVTVAPLEDGRAMFEGSFELAKRFSGEPGYSTLLVFEIDADTPIVWRRGEKHEWETPS